jgi:uncharacterized membrane protein
MLKQLKEISNNQEFQLKKLFIHLLIKQIYFISSFLLFIFLFLFFLTFVSAAPRNFSFHTSFLSLSFAKTQIKKTQIRPLEK